MTPGTIERFSSRKIEWAQNEFRNEISGGFNRAMRFDGVESQCQLEALLDQSDENLFILARILPFGVFSEDPVSHEIRKGLEVRELSAVLRLRKSYEAICEMKSQARLECLRRTLLRKATPEYRATREIVQKICKDCRTRFKLTLETGGPGEWALWDIKNGYRHTLSVHLNHALELRISVGCSKENFSQRLCLNDDFYTVLGIGTASIDCSNIETVESRVNDLISFSVWHSAEYAELIAEI